MNNCFIVDESKFNLDSIIDIIEQENYYLFGINKLDFINKPKNYFLDSNYETLVLDDNLIVNLYNNLKLEVYANGKKEIFIEISDANQKVLFTSLNKDYGELFYWNIYANSSNKQFNEIRQDSNLLTGCISL